MVQLFQDKVHARQHIHSVESMECYTKQIIDVLILVASNMLIKCDVSMLTSY